MNSISYPLTINFHFPLDTKTLTIGLEAHNQEEALFLDAFSSDENLIRLGCLIARKNSESLNADIIDNLLDLLDQDDQHENLGAFELLLIALHQAGDRATQPDNFITSDTLSLALSASCDLMASSMIIKLMSVSGQAFLTTSIVSAVLKANKAESTYLLRLCQQICPAGLMNERTWSHIAPIIRDKDDMPICFSSLGNDFSDLSIKKFRALQLCGSTPAERLCKVLEKVIPQGLLTFNEDNLIVLAQSCASSYFFTASLLALPKNCPRLSGWEIERLMVFPTQALTLSFCLQRIEALEPGNLTSEICSQLINRITCIDKIAECLFSIERDSGSSLFEHYLIASIFRPHSAVINFSHRATPPTTRPNTPPPTSPIRML